MTTTIIRAATRRGGVLRRIRKECRALDDTALLRRLCRYTGRTIGEERRTYRELWPAGTRSIRREVVIDIIANYEAGS